LVRESIIESETVLVAPTKILVWADMMAQPGNYSSVGLSAVSLTV
jgi:hypothetical protein